MRCICPGIQDIQKYDVLNVQKFALDKIGEDQIFVVKEGKRLFTDLKVKLGVPIPLGKDNPNENNIAPKIPEDAKNIMDVASPVKNGTRKYKPVKALILYEKNWTIKVRLTNIGPKIGTKKNKNSFIISLEFIDEDDTAISAILCGEAVEKYEKILHKGKVYLISNGEVKIAQKKYSSIKNDFALTLDKQAIIEESEDDKNIKEKGFNFTEILKIAGLADSVLIDVLGVVIQGGTKQSHTAKKTRSGAGEFSNEPAEKMFKRSIVIADESNASITLTLWRQHADLDIPVGSIIGVKRVKVTSYQDKQIGTTGASEVIVNPPHARAAILKKMVEDRSIFNNAPAIAKSSSKPTVTIYVF